MTTITTKNLGKTRVQTPSKEEEAQATGSSGSSQASSSDTASDTWSQAEDGTFKSSSGAKHWGDKQPKVAVTSKEEAEALIREVDPTAKFSGTVVKSDRDTLETYIIQIGGRTIISGPLAATVAQSRGLNALTSGDGDPAIAAQAAEGAKDETGSG